ncbi:MAG: hypothetical protein P8P99_15030 [Maricaulis sp.]|nr:hypothetical protein [Maricaulis sp.]
MSYRTREMLVQELNGLARVVIRRADNEWQRAEYDGALPIELVAPAEFLAENGALNLPSRWRYQSLCITGSKQTKCLDLWPFKDCLQSLAVGEIGETVNLDDYPNLRILSVSHPTRITSSNSRCLEELLVFKVRHSSIVDLGPTDVGYIELIGGNIENLILPDNLTAENMGIYRMPKLKSVNFESLKGLRSLGFEKCKSLTIDREAIRWMTNLERMSVVQSGIFDYQIAADLPRLEHLNVQAGGEPAAHIDGELRQKLKFYRVGKRQITA